MGRNLLWAPWRSEYILGKKEKGCIFCNRLRQRTDAKNLIVYRAQRIFVILNKFPYNSGHTMVVPNRHISELNQLSKAEAVEFFETIRFTVKVSGHVFRPDSFNIGMNMGHGSGAGIPEHLHMHIVPRWTEDTNFMAVIGNTEVVSFSNELIYRKLRKGFIELCPGKRSRRKRS
jgi:ATP adenylyltransferase